MNKKFSLSKNQHKILTINDKDGDIGLLVDFDDVNQFQTILTLKKVLYILNDNWDKKDYEFLNEPFFNPQPEECQFKNAKQYDKAYNNWWDETDIKMRQIMKELEEK
jgi:hypothetical protein